MPFTGLTPFLRSLRKVRLHPSSLLRSSHTALLPDLLAFGKGRRLAFCQSTDCQRHLSSLDLDATQLTSMDGSGLRDTGRGVPNPEGTRLALYAVGSFPDLLKKIGMSELPSLVENTVSSSLPHRQRSKSAQGSEVWRLLQAMDLLQVLFATVVLVGSSCSSEKEQPGQSHRHQGPGGASESLRAKRPLPCALGFAESVLLLLQRCRALAPSSLAWVARASSFLVRLRFVVGPSSWSLGTFSTP